MDLLRKWHKKMLLFNKIEEEGRTGSAWKQGGWGRRGDRGQGENDPNNVYTYE
jgi:hypothetical protein